MTLGELFTLNLAVFIFPKASHVMVTSWNLSIRYEVGTDYSIPFRTNIRDLPTSRIQLLIPVELLEALYEI